MVSTARIEGITDAIRKMRSPSETDVAEATTFLCTSLKNRSNEAAEALIGYLASPRVFFGPPAEKAVDALVREYAVVNVERLQEIYDTTSNDDIATIIGKRLEFGKNAPGLEVGDNDELGKCIKRQSAMFEDCFHMAADAAAEKAQQGLDPKAMQNMLGVFSNSSFDGDLLDESSRQTETYRSALAKMREWLAGTCPLGVEHITKMVNSSINGWEILENWALGLSKVQNDKRADIAKAMAKSLLTKNINALFSMNGNPVSKRLLSEDVEKLAMGMPTESARFFFKDITPILARETPEAGARMQAMLASPDELFDYLKSSPMLHLDRIKDLLAHPEKSSCKDFMVRALREIVPQVYSNLDQGLLESIWESSNEPVRIAMVQAVGERWPGSRLMSIYRSTASTPLKAAVAQVLVKNKQDYLLPSNDREL